MAYQALGNKILIKKIQKEIRKETSFGLILANTSQDVLQWAEVVSLGKKAKDELPELLPGDIIVYQDLPADEYDGNTLIEIGQIFAKLLPDKK